MLNDQVLGFVNDKLSASEILNIIACLFERFRIIPPESDDFVLAGLLTERGL